MRNPIEGFNLSDDDDKDDDEMDMTCYKEGLAVDRNFQMCDVTNRKIIDTIPDNKPPQVTFSCSAGGPRSNSSLVGGGRYGFLDDDTLDPSDKMGTCGFQFWVDRIESFYCKLEECQWTAEEGYGETSLSLELADARWKQRDPLSLRQDGMRVHSRALPLRRERQCQ